MIVSAPYRLVAERSALFRRAVLALSSEQWTVAGLCALCVAALAGAAGNTVLFALMLLLHDVTDLNDGYVYQQKEKGQSNGYGLYLDHMLDGFGAALVAYGLYRLVGWPMWCAAGLVLYYLIAIHAWLYKITRLNLGETRGAYYGVTLSERRMLWVNTDDLTAAVAVLAFTGGAPWAFYVTAVALVTVLLVKVSRAVLELRATQWRPVAEPVPAPRSAPRPAPAAGFAEP